MLDVMTELMCKDVRLREVAARAEPILQLVVKPEIDVDLLIYRAVERSHRGLRISAGRLCRVPEENELGSRIGRIRPAENFLPCAVVIIEHIRDELHLSLFAR